MDNRLFRDAMGKFATGITVVTTEFNNDIYGMTVNAFMSVSLDPKLIAVSIDEKAEMYHILQESKKFGVSILTTDQKDASMMFAKQIEQDPAIIYKQKDGIPVLKNALTTLSCQLHDKIEAGDHMIFIAEVTEMEMNEGKPLLYYGGKYQELSD